MYRHIVLIFISMLAVSTFANNQNLVVRPCDDNTATSLENYISNKSYANGNIRLFHVDTDEPVCCSSHLIIYLTKPEPPIESRCFHIATNTDGLGFQSTDLSKAKTTYNAANGITMQLPIFFYNDTGVSSRKNFTLIINQKSQTVIIK